MELSQVVNPGFIRPWHYLVIVPQTVRKIFSWTCWLAGWLTGWILKYEYFCVECCFPGWLAGWLAAGEQRQAGQVWLGRLGGSPQLTQCRKDLLINLIFELSPPHQLTHLHPLHHQDQIPLWSCGLMLCGDVELVEPPGPNYSSQWHSMAELGSRYLAWSRWRLIRVWLPITCLDSD